MVAIMIAFRGKAVRSLLPRWAVSRAPDPEHVQIKLTISPSPHRPKTLASCSVFDFIKWHCPLASC